MILQTLRFGTQQHSTACKRQTTGTKKDGTRGTETVSIPLQFLVCVPLSMGCEEAIYKHSLQGYTSVPCLLLKWIHPVTTKIRELVVWLSQKKAQTYKNQQQPLLAHPPQNNKSKTVPKHKKAHPLKLKNHYITHCIILFFSHNYWIMPLPHRNSTSLVMTRPMMLIFESSFDTPQ